jgi:hypothetical protein
MSEMTVVTKFFSAIESINSVRKNEFFVVCPVFFKSNYTNIVTLKINKMLEME